MAATPCSPTQSPAAGRRAWMALALAARDAWRSPVP